MTKRYVLNPDTNRLVNADGYTGLKVINKLLTKGMQIKYHSSKKEQSPKKKETPTKKQPAQAAQKKRKKNDTFVKTVIDLTNQQEQTSKKIQQQQQKQTPKKRKKTQSVTKQQVKKDLIKIKEEIKDFYDAIAERYIYASEEPNPGHEGFFYYVNEIYIDENNLEKMKTFMKISGLSLEEVKQIYKKVYAKYIYDEDDEDMYDASYNYDPLDYSVEVFYKIINTGSFANDPTVKNDLKNYLRKVTNNIKSNVQG